MYYISFNNLYHTYTEMHIVYYISRCMCIFARENKTSEINMDYIVQVLQAVYV